MIVRTTTPEGRPCLAAAARPGAPPRRMEGRLADLLRMPRAAFDAAWRDAAESGEELPAAATPLAPLDGEMEVWAAGVTYKRSEQARMEESETPDIYARVYGAERPELFFKANARRVAGPGRPVVIRADSSWNVPEPELALVVNAHAEIVGYTIANDSSSREIEGENPLYLPQAKVHAACCGLGPAIMPAAAVPDPLRLGIRMRIERDGAQAWSGETSTAELHRELQTLVDYLFREDEHPCGVVLCTGAGLVPDPPFTLAEGDVVQIEIDGLGTLTNPVVAGKAALPGSPTSQEADA
ncbi:MAG: fumarylacetoacetate hydrolase family protein [Conexibacter sp.]